MSLPHSPIRAWRAARARRASAGHAALPATSADQCRRCHQAVRQTVLVPTAHGVVGLVECRICDRGRCPSCRIVLADRAVVNCPACHARLSLSSAGSAG